MMRMTTTMVMIVMAMRNNDNNIRQVYIGTKYFPLVFSLSSFCLLCIIEYDGLFFFSHILFVPFILFLVPFSLPPSLFCLSILIQSMDK